MRRPQHISITGALALVVLAACVSPRQPAPIPPSAVIGVREAQLTPDYWIARDANSRRIVLDAAAIAAQNARLRELDPSVHDLESLPPTLAGADVKQWIQKLSARPDGTLFDDQGRAIPAATLDALMNSIALDAVPPTQPTRYGLVVRRADLRRFPTLMRVFDSRDNTDIDRFQESALFPGTPVVIVHESRDRQWWFVVSPLYSAWIEKRFVAEGSAAKVLDYTRRKPYLVVTGPTVKTVFTPEHPEVSELQLDMGVRVPVLTDWPPSKLVNGQHPYTAHVIELPTRAEDGSLRFAPALLPKTADTASDYLPLNEANVVRQGFKFLGERYGWGHSYNARDCSGFVSEVYRSFGVQLPRNTRDQATSPALNRITFTSADDHARRVAVLRELDVGDLIYIPGHVMMVIGHDDGMPYVIHDTTGISYRDGTGSVRRVALNGVSVTPLTPLLLGKDQPLVDRITSILRVRR
ncbi:MAG TPA: SH3 domain-containing protein [Steroidobacteraceae bacterium]|nr:SH3 domain-containing protein [Steroidobacteraceae bacterium]